MPQKVVDVRHNGMAIWLICCTYLLFTKSIYMKHFFVVDKLILQFDNDKYG